MTSFGFVIREPYEPYIMRHYSICTLIAFIFALGIKKDPFAESIIPFEDGDTSR